MGLEQVRAGIGVTGSFCTFQCVFERLEEIKKNHPGIDFTFVLSHHVQTLPNRFYSPEETLARAETLSARVPVLTIPQAEPLGPKGLLDLFVIAPCTGNTLAKLAAGVTDGPVLMATKGHLRGGKPLLIFLSSNDALGLNLKNIGTLLNTKHIYFVPFGQDAPGAKPNSLVAKAELLPAAMEAALRGEQMQPILV
ncbi:MAG: dipicolinate synthase subunit B [Oscillospiraceae bacterium]|jgi:dipicolinate synthase subunit B|nr:dipicolinate synthase subunit B [Oscillospiraceae bacterium]